MNSPAKSLCKKTHCRGFFIFLALILIAAFGYLYYCLLFNLEFPVFIPTLLVGILLLWKVLRPVLKTSHLKYKNQALIVKPVFQNAILTPLKATKIDPILSFSNYTLLCVHFDLDGKHHRYYSLTNYEGIQILKKRQAISRVL